MAAPPSAVPAADALVSIKVAYCEGTTRFKLPLRDLGIHAFEDKVRAFLNVPDDASMVIERFSDSARSFVALTKNDTALYKQLYRAAKAKKKLKLRVTASYPEDVQSVSSATPPKPVTVEDEPESEQSDKKEADEESNITAPNDAPQPQENGKNSTHAPVSSSAIDTLRRGSQTASFVAMDQDAQAILSRKQRVCSREAGLESTDTLAKFLMRGAQETQPAAAKEDTGKESETVMEQKADAAPACPSESTNQPQVVSRPFTVCCNSCDRPIPDVHFHCSICDDGDFDLCRDCVNRGISCHSEGHWLIKRTIVDGHIKCSTTHVAPSPSRPKISSRPKITMANVPQPSPPAAAALASLAANGPPRMPVVNPYTISPSLHRTLVDLLPPSYSTRTCNCCVREFTEAMFVHCTSCDDYDLCKTCFDKDQHGHHPSHGFTAAVPGTVFDYTVASRLPPGRNARHNAICDGCDRYIRGVRHKCLDCPDWDYCAECVKDAAFVHSSHRFVPIYEPLIEHPMSGTDLRATHYGICCDGPLCKTRSRDAKYIVGERYKCAVCHDTDFCANCEASPANTHNKTHPLLKFKTPVRHVSVTTTGEHVDGQRLPPMGDKLVQARAVKMGCAKKHTSSAEHISATPVQTVVDVQPTEHSERKPEQQVVTPTPVEVAEPTPAVELTCTSATSESAKELPKESPNELNAVFVWDAVKDGSTMVPNRTFEQTWYLRNDGTTPWPAGCSVKFIGGDYMGAVDCKRPAGLHELMAASQSTVCHDALYPGQGFPFSVRMRTPDREGKFISYWRLTTPEGAKFGHKLWCHVNVEAPRQAEEKTEEEGANLPLKTVDQKLVHVMNELSLEEGPAKSGMVIPKLEHESPSHSMHEGGAQGEDETGSDTVALSAAPSAVDEDDFEDCGGPDWAEESDEGFMTDEEYDILDASDEEFLFQQQKKQSGK
ncbi:hypothetical protein GGS20DRAFT_568184 [Poronia punctata]|nr:hypothetical protein GGS20DRAFT_568184 [Poronia punctata]